MFAFIKEKYFTTLQALDTASSRLSRRTYDIGSFTLNDIPIIHRLEGARWMAKLVEPVLVAVVLGGLAYLSRYAQFEFMASDPSAYFLSGLRNVATTNDSGYFMNLASELLRSGSQHSIVDVRPGELLAFILYTLSAISGSHLEEVGRWLTYTSAFLTSYSAYLLMRAMGQSWMGVLVAIGMLLIGPIYSRTSLGMIDTDLLNLFFVLLISTCIIISAQAQSLVRSILFSISAGLTNFLFFLFYTNAGFTLIFVATLILYSLATRIHPYRIFATTSLFILTSGAQAITGGLDRILTFLNTYILPSNTFSHSLLQNQADGSSPTLIFETISEITPFSTVVVAADFGSVTAFVVGLIGLLAWITVKWTRFFALLPLMPFILFYFLGGQRFAYYIAVPVLIGLIFFCAQVLQVLSPLLRNMASESSPHGEAATVERRGPSRYWSAIVSGLAILLVAGFGKVFYPLGLTPPPTIKAIELRPMLESMREYENKKPIVTSWWDYGHELRYQTGAVGITDGSNPADIRNIYIARALISQSPLYAADELRFAAYFSEQLLNNYFPRRPPIELANNIETDILIFIPSDLQYKMFPVYQIATKSLHEDALRNYNPEKSLFFELFHRRPKTFGPFELMVSQDGGSVVYRLPAPKK